MSFAAAKAGAVQLMAVPTIDFLNACDPLERRNPALKSGPPPWRRASAMTSTIRKALGVLLVSLATACSQQPPLQGHQLRLFAADRPDASWITQDDVKSAQRSEGAGGQPVLRLHLRPDAASRMLALTNANVGKTVRFAWDGNVVSEMKVASAFGATFELPAPPM
jgi:hypothetical protein